jgi:HAD superfamily hydrolase (TIGR01490 family)
VSAAVVSTAQRTVAAFDFDGTLTHHDSLVPFLMRVRGRAAVMRALVSSAPVLLASATGRESRERGKEALLIATVNGWWVDELGPAVDEYAREVVEKRLRPDRVERLRWHQEQGHEVVLVSASPELYVGRVGELLGCAGVIATQLEVDRRGRLTGRLFGDNVWGVEKERLLREWLAGDAVRLYAYGDSDGDAQMLAMADVGVRLGGRDRLGREPEPGPFPSR